MSGFLSLLGKFLRLLLLKTETLMLVLYSTGSPSGPKSKLANGRTVTNLASYNFYNFNATDQIKDKAIQTLRTYGVGPCGPPQFYGTQDVHMQAEADIAAYIGTEGCIVYAQAFSTISSVIPSFCKRGDVIVVDRAVNYSIRKGLELSRSSIKWYNHGDMDDLEAQLKKVVLEQAKQKAVDDGWNRLATLDPESMSGDDRSEWMKEAAALIDIFRETRELFGGNRVRCFLRWILY